MKSFRSPSGVQWGVDVRSPGSSNAMVVFLHPDGHSSRKNRYAWYLAQGPEARSVTSRLTPSAVLAMLTDADVARLFRRSMPVDAPSTPYNRQLDRNA